MTAVFALIKFKCYSLCPDCEHCEVKSTFSELNWSKGLEMIQCIVLNPVMADFSTLCQEADTVY